MSNLIKNNSVIKPRNYSMSTDNIFQQSYTDDIEEHQPVHLGSFNSMSTDDNNSSYFIVNDNESQHHDTVGYDDVSDSLSVPHTTVASNVTIESTSYSNDASELIPDNNTLQLLSHANDESNVVGDSSLTGSSTSRKVNNMYSTIGMLPSQLQQHELSLTNDDTEVEDDEDEDEDDSESIDVCGDSSDLLMQDDLLCSSSGSTMATNTLCSSGAGRGRGLTGRGRGGGSGRARGRGRGRGYLPPAVAEGLARHEAVQQRVYKRKYKQMKNSIRSLVLVCE